jgi:hypothetical protein
MCPKCRALLVGEEPQRRKDQLEHRLRFLDRISYPAALIVAAVLGFEGTRLGLALNEAKPKPAAFRVEMAKPPYCSIKTPDRLFFL